MNKTAITITTINVPKILEDICQNLADHGRKGEADIIVIGDKKTPDEVKNFCGKVSEKFGVKIEYLGISEQEAAFSDKKDLLDLFPYNTPDRVMLGGMLAYFRGYERLIAVDDDNFPTRNDFVGFHSITGKEAEINLLETESGWFNVHNALVEENNIPFYPRGFPWKQRIPASNKKVSILGRAKVVANQGLVLEDPDIDAISRLFWPIRAIAIKSDFDPQFALQPGTWSPFNYQNTSLCRELIPCYYRPVSAIRNGDIWTAYLINRLAHHFGDVITFGQPLVKQIRNIHDIWDDLDIELVNNKATDYLISILRSVELTEKTYFKALIELLEKSKNKVGEMANIPPAELKMIKAFFEEYLVWCNIVSKMI